MLQNVIRGFGGEEGGREGGREGEGEGNIGNLIMMVHVHLLTEAYVTECYKRVWRGGGEEGREGGGEGGREGGREGEGEGNIGLNLIVIVHLLTEAATMF